jgi:nucleoside-diphosphate-sugar epimerase
MAKRGWLPALGTRNAAYTFVYVDDLVAAIERAIDSACSSDVMFVGHPAPVTTARMATAMGAALGRRVTLVRVPDLVARAALIASEIAGALIGREMPLNRRRFGEMSAVGFACRVDRLRERLGVVPRVDLEEGVRRTAEWYRREGWL